jgi:hypothetical protein
LQLGNGCTREEVIVLKNYCRRILLLGEEHLEDTATTKYTNAGTHAVVHVHYSPAETKSDPVLSAKHSLVGNSANSILELRAPAIWGGEGRSWS